MKVYFIGIFPPPYGGVTVKNENLYNALCTDIMLKKIDLNKIKRFDLLEIVKLLYALFNRNCKFIIGVAGIRKQFTRFLYLFNRKTMSKSIIFIMGGEAAKEIASDKMYLKEMSHYEKIYVETFGMKATLNKVGLSNVDVYPNARFRPQHDESVGHVNCNKIMKCLFFSLISKSKGADIVLEVAKNMPNIEFHFYGHVDGSFSSIFFSDIKKYKNVIYHGIYEGTQEEIYSELSKYDVLLLPTTWKAEGVPGILVETKIVGIPAIVSNHNYNSEIITNGEDGIVLEENTANCIIKHLNNFNTNRDMLMQMSIRAKLSSSNYYIENHIDTIKKIIKA